MLTGLTPTVCGVSEPPLRSLPGDLSNPVANILTSTSPALGSSIASDAPSIASGTVSAAGSPSSGAMWIASMAGPASTAAIPAPAIAVAGSGGLPCVPYDASPTGVPSAVIQPLTLTESPPALSGGKPEARITPLVLHPGSGAGPDIVLGVWIGDSGVVFLVHDGSGNDDTAAPPVGDGIKTQLTGGVLADSQPASNLADAELEPKVAAQILAALSRGDIQLAMELLAGIGAKGANLAPKFLEKIQGLYRIGDGQCEDIASRTAAVFRAMGDSPVILRITDSRGSRVWQFGGEIMTRKGFHEATNNAGTIYDHLTGPNGMLLEEYLRLLRTAVGITPVVLPK